MSYFSTSLSDPRNLPPPATIISVVLLKTRKKLRNGYGVGIGTYCTQSSRPRVTADRKN